MTKTTRKISVKGMLYRQFEILNDPEAPMIKKATATCDFCMLGGRFIKGYIEKEFLKKFGTYVKHVFKVELTYLNDKGHFRVGQWRGIKYDKTLGSWLIFLEFFMETKPQTIHWIKRTRADDEYEWSEELYGLLSVRMTRPVFDWVLQKLMDDNVINLTDKIDVAADILLPDTPKDNASNDDDDQDDDDDD